MKKLCRLRPVHLPAAAPLPEPSAPAGATGKRDGSKRRGCPVPASGNADHHAVEDRFLPRLASVFLLYTKGQVRLKDIPRLLRKTKCTPTEREVLALAGKAPLSTAELLLSMERGILIRKEEDILEKLYTSPEDTCSTLTDTVQITHAQYPILQAVSNLYLNQKILFQKI